MQLRLLAALTVLILGVSSSAIAQEARDFSARSARVTRGPGGGPVTGPSQAARPEIVSAFLAARHDAPTVQSLRLERQNPSATGVTHLTFGQQIAGLDVYGTYVKAAVTARGEIVSVVENLARIPPGLVPATETHRGALEAVLARYYAGVAADMPETGALGETIRYARTQRFSEEPTVTRVAVPMSNGALQTGYLVVTWDRDNILRHTVVGAGGRILVEELRTNTDTYRIFTNHPGLGGQIDVTGPGSGNAESRHGWLFGNVTTGNNVDAYLDRDNNNAPDANGRPTGSSGSFLFTFDGAASPTMTTNQMAAVTNLFYLNNVIHDKLYRHGFTEGAGNFQEDNFGLGGAGSDSVNAEAQDGGGTNNANFATPSDGSNPRMQMYLWTSATPNRDGDLDSDIVWHEYGHGLTWRMIGGMSSNLGGAIGEGMSDTLAIWTNRDQPGGDVVGEYSYNNVKGIRRYAYSSYPLTYGSVTGSSVHNDGEIYAATMWRLMDLWEGSGRSRDSLWDVVIDGMNYTPAAPAFEHMRDGILQAASTQAEDCLVWQAFAAFGIGEGATGSASCSIFRCRATVSESFTVPSICTSGGGGNTAPTVAITAPANGDSFSDAETVTFTGTATDTEDGDLTNGLSWSSDRDGFIGSGGSVSTSGLSVGTHVVTASVSDAGNLSGSTTVGVTITLSGGGSSITLDANGYKVKGIKAADLSWSGATTTSVDIYRDGAKITTTANDGAYTDDSGQKGGGSFSYQVCEAGSTTACSPTVTVVF